MTTPELQEAEARVREAMTKPYYAMTYEANTAAWVLARAWLAERDETPIDEAFLKSVGFRSDSRFVDGVPLTIALPAEDPENYVPYLVCWEDFSLGIWAWRWVGKDRHDDTREMIGVDVDLPCNQTRGYLRTLCRALGIPLKETP